MVTFVAGATGFVGREVVRLLVEAGHETVAHVRPDSSRLAQWRQRFAELGARVDDTAWTAEAMAARLAELQPAAVFGLLGTTRKRGKASGDTYQTVDYGLSVMLLEAAAAAGSRPRFVYLSSAGVSDRARGAYLKARARTERAVRESGLPYTIARPSFITGPGRDDSRPGERVGAAVADGLLTVAGLVGARRTKARYSSTSNTALAAALVRLAFDPDAADQIIESEGLR